jgi:triacylglycerol lipase
MDSQVASPTSDQSPRTFHLPTLRAAYSDRTAALMARLAQLAYDGDFEPPSINLPAGLAQLGFTSVQSFADPKTQGVAFLAESGELIALSFRGTKTERNWITDLTIDFLHPDGANEKLSVHRGFYEAFCQLADSGLTKAIEAAKKKSSGRTPIYVTGHSLGGALAQIAAAKFGDDQIAACYTFGSPRVGNSYFDLWVKAPSYRVVNHADIVPQLPLPIGYRHSGDPRYLPEKIEGSPFRYEPNAFVRAGQLAKGVAEAMKKRSILQVEDHAIAQYAEKLEEIVRARSQQR